MGDELGMQDTPIPQAAVRDPAELRQPDQGQGRDPVRTPFPWDDSPGRGFTTGVPWLPIGTDASLAVQRDDPASMLALHRRLIALRRAHPALSVGGISDVVALGAVLTYSRTLDGARFEVALNTGGAHAEVRVEGGTVVADTTRAEPYAMGRGRLGLSPNQGVLIRC